MGYHKTVMASEFPWEDHDHRKMTCNITDNHWYNGTETDHFYSCCLSVFKEYAAEREWKGKWSMAVWFDKSSVSELCICLCCIAVVFNILAWVPPTSPRVLPLSTSAYLVSHHFNESPVSCLSPFEAILPQPYAYGCTAAPQQCLFTVDQALQTVQIYFPNFRTILFFFHPSN